VIFFPAAREGVASVTHSTPTSKFRRERAEACKGSEIARCSTGLAGFAMRVRGTGKVCCPELPCPFRSLRVCSLVIPPQATLKQDTDAYSAFARAVPRGAWASLALVPFSPPPA
jgi:hypothetical protein